MKAIIVYYSLEGNTDYTAKLLAKELGTRHRAGIGITENSDAISLIVSEETGAISVAKNGNLKRNVTSGELREILLDELIISNNKVEKKSKKAKKKGGNR